MVITGCPGYSLAIPRVILGEPIQLPSTANPASEPASKAVSLPPRVEVYNSQGAWLPSGKAVGTIVNYLA